MSTKENGLPQYLGDLERLLHRDKARREHLPRDLRPWVDLSNRYSQEVLR
jgi:hypothetical protein